MMTKTSNTQKSSTMARIALGATAVLALAGHANAAACGPASYYDGITKTGAGNTFNTAADCTTCPTGTASAATALGTAATFCESLAANFYGSVGNVLSAHATATACPFGGTRAGAATTDQALSTCGATSCVAGQSVAAGNTCVCAANYYGVPKDANGDIIAAMNGGCTACPYGGTSAQGTTALSGCTPDCVTTNTASLASAVGGTCVCAANTYGSPTPTNAAASAGCTKCPFAGTATAGTAAVTSCTPNCGANSLIEANAGTCRCKAASWGSPLDTNGQTTLAAVRGCATCAATYAKAAAGSVESVAGQSTVAGCTVAKGFYVSVDGNGVPENVVTTAVPTGYYRGVLAPGAADSAALDTAAKCPDGTATSLGANSISECYVSDGYRLSVAGTLGNAGTVVQVAANSYVARRSDAPKSADSTVAESLVACPFGGKSAAGAFARSQCTPDCSTTYSGSGAVANDGTCVCATGYFGTPLDTGAGTTSAAASGCTSCASKFPMAISGSVTTAGPGATSDDDCVVASGYYVSSGATSAAEVVVTALVPANSYAPSGHVTLGNVRALTHCPAHSTSAAGSDDISDCKCDAGYVSTASTCEACAGRAAGDAVGTVNACSAGSATPGAPGAPAAASGASSVSVFAAAAAVAAAQLVL